MKKIYIICFLLLTSCVIVYAQKKTTEYSWENTKSTTYITDSLLNNDAVCIYNLQEIRYRRGGLTYFINKTRIKILTPRGLDRYSSFSVLKPNYTIVNTLDARAIKNDGRIVDFNSEDIKVIDIKFKKNQGIKIQKLSVPGVEIGDEIEFIYIFQFDGILEDEDIFLHAEIPTINSTFKQILDKEYVIEHRLYNKMPSPLLTKRETESEYVWVLNNIQGTSDNDYGILQESLPFIRYSVFYNPTKNVNAREFLALKNKVWAVMYDYYSLLIKNDVFESMYRGKSLEGFLIKQNAKYPNQTIDQKILFLSSILNDSLTITEFDPQSPSRPAMYYLINKTMDTRVIYRFIDSYLRLNNIKYFVAFSRNRYEGNLDINFATPKTVTEIFYVIMNENKELHYLYPPSPNSKYYIDELPNSIAGTQAILITDLGGFKSDRLNITTMSIPYNEINTNIWSKKINIKLNLKNNETNSDLTSQHTLVGDMSTNLRNNIINIGYSKDSLNRFKELSKINSSHTIDTIYTEKFNKIYPYNFTYTYKANVYNLIQKIENNTYSIAIDKIISHYTLPTFEQHRILDYYCPFAYTDVTKIYLVFDSEIEVINNDLSTNMAMNNPVANYSIQVRKMDKNILMIESKLDLIKIKLNPAEYNELHKVNERVKKTSQSRILIKTI